MSASERPIKAAGDYIGGRFVRRRHADGELSSVDPADLDTTIGVFPRCDGAVDEAVAAAVDARQLWASTSPAERLAGLRKLEAQLQNYAEAFTELLCRETGRPRWETRDEARALRREVASVLRQGVAELTLEQRPPPGCAVTFRPRGVVALLVPSSQPALSLHSDLVAALAVGCTVVAKPSPQTPALGQLYAEVMHEVDLPAGVFNLVQGGEETGDRLACHPDVDAVLFAGREENALRLEAKLAEQERERRTRGPQRARPVLRALCAGRPGALVVDDANLDEAAAEIAIGACLSAGQRCSTTRGVVVQRRVADALRSRLLHLIAKLKIGPGTQPDVFLGPMISDGAELRYLEDLERLRQAGAEELVEGGRVEQGSQPTRGHFVTPALFEVESDDYLTHLAPEASGPLLLFTVVDELDRGIELLARSPRKLCHAAFTRDETLLARLAAELEVPLLLHNAQTTYWRPELPLERHSPAGAALPAGALTARALTVSCSTVTRDSAFDQTMLPPGLPR